MIAFPAPAAEAAQRGLRLWATAVVPVLGPFMACMLMLTTRAGGGMPLRVALCWLCGSPGGARLLQLSPLSGTSALRLAAMTGTMSPMFFLGTLSAWLQDAGAGWKLLLCHLVSALLLGLCIPCRDQQNPFSPPPMALGQALRESALALLTIGLCMMLGCVSARMALCVFPSLPPGWAAALQCALEITAGAKALIGLEPSTLRLPLLCAACSFGGLSLLMQNAAFWQESGVTPARLLVLRLLHGVLAFFLCLCLPG